MPLKPSLVLSLLLALQSSLAFADERPAKEIFGGVPGPSSGPARVIGGYARGCVAGAVELPADGPHWQAMRPSRNRAWGHPDLISFIKDLARVAAEEDGWPGLLVGDMSQPRGGPMLTGHASHQSGLDADIWLTPMPDRRLTTREREDMSATLVVENGPYVVKKDVWTRAHFNLIKRAASDVRVDRVLVAAGIKKALCEMETGDKAWLRTVRPYWGHNYHMHVRLKCPQGSTTCRPQAVKPLGDGCGSDLDWWFSQEPWRPPKPEDKPKPKPPLTLAGLPPLCRSVAVETKDARAPAVPLPLPRPADAASDG